MFDARTVDRFWSRVDKTPGLGPKGDCWEWTGGKRTGGYGAFAVASKPTGAHRFSLMLKLGRALRPDMMSCHECDHPPCVRPEHLYEGTHRDNARDAVLRGRHASRKARPFDLALALRVRAAYDAPEIPTMGDVAVALGMNHLRVYVLLRTSCAEEWPSCNDDLAKNGCDVCRCRERRDDLLSSRFCGKRCRRLAARFGTATAREFFVAAAREARTERHGPTDRFFSPYRRAIYRAANRQLYGRERAASWRSAHAA